MSCRPCGDRLFRQENAYGIDEFAVGSNVEDKFCRRSFGIAGERGPLTHEVVLVDVSLSTSVGLHAADRLLRRHGDIMKAPWGFVPVVEISSKLAARRDELDCRRT